MKQKAIKLVILLLDPTAMPVDMDDQDEAFPKISLQEMLEGLNLAEDEEVVGDVSDEEDSGETPMMD